MPALTLNFLKSLKEDYRSYPIFVETGTCGGDTIFAMENLFSKLFSVEITEEHYERAKSNYSGEKIKFFFGDSAKVITDILTECNENTLFFLDAHNSGPSFCNLNITTLYTPLEEELKKISKNSKHESLVIIDDCRVFGTKGSNWESISEELILKITKDRLLNYYYMDCNDIKNDRLILHLKAL
jgi:hypothetical protein